MSVLASVSVPATSANLGPGYDAFGIAVGLRLYVSAVARPAGAPRVTTIGEGADEVASDDSNLVWQSVVTACESFGWSIPDVALQVQNPIPLARGLGSSSAAIVAGLGIARVLAGADASVSASEAGAARDGSEVEAVGDVALTQLADQIEGHPDNVAPAVHGGLVACAPTDAGASVVRLSPPPPTTRPVMLVPATRLLTTVARGVVPDALDRPDVVVQAARAGHVLGGLLGAWVVDPALAGDRLHESARGEVIPDAAALLTALRSAGHHAWLSGAGPSIAVSVRTLDQPALADVLSIAARHEHAAHVLAWDRSGIIACGPVACGVSGSSSCAVCPKRGV